MRQRYPSVEKTCEQCGQAFNPGLSPHSKLWATRKFCSRTCQATAKRAAPRTASMIPCRICGQPTKYAGTENGKMWGTVRCERPECVAASKRIRADRAVATLKQHQTEGVEFNYQGWTHRGQVSQQERSLAECLTAEGWTGQHRVRCGVNGGYMLDLAVVSELVCVEIDGESHRFRVERDARRDAKLGELGWRVLRIDVRDVDQDFDAVVSRIREWRHRCSLQAA